MASGAGVEKLDEVCAAVAKQPWPGWGSGSANQIRAFARDVKANDYLWTRDTDGRYVLGRFNRGSWRFCAEGDDPKLAGLDLHQLRSIEWARTRLEPEETPGSVVRCFSGPGRAWQGIRSELTARVTHEVLWPELNGRKGADVACSIEEVLEDLLSPNDLEDLVLIFLQVERGYAMVPSSRGRGTPLSECTLVHRSTFAKARPQVKSGRAALDWGPLAATVSKGERAIGFAASGIYKGRKSSRCEEIPVGELVTFVRSKEGRAILPRRITRWIS